MQKSAVLEHFARRDDIEDIEGLEGRLGTLMAEREEGDAEIDQLKLAIERSLQLATIKAEIRQRDFIQGVNLSKRKIASASRGFHDLICKMDRMKAHRAGYRGQAILSPRGEQRFLPWDGWETDAIPGCRRLR